MPGYGSAPTKDDAQLSIYCFVVVLLACRLSGKHYCTCFTPLPSLESCYDHSVTHVRRTCPDVDIHLSDYSLLTVLVTKAKSPKQGSVQLSTTCDVSFLPQQTADSSKGQRAWHLELSAPSTALVYAGRPGRPQTTSQTTDAPVRRTTFNDSRRATMCVNQHPSPT